MHVKRIELLYVIFLLKNFIFYLRIVEFYRFQIIIIKFEWIRIFSELS